MSIDLLQRLLPSLLPRPLRLLALPVAAAVLLAGCTAESAPQRAATPASGPSGEWPQWRGPERDGTAPGDALARDWQASPPREIWRRPLGEGFAGIAIAGGRTFTLFADGKGEQLIALDARTGDELWHLGLGETFRDSTGNGPRTTPAVDGQGDSETVYALGSRTLVAAAAVDGAVRWRLELAPGPRWGYASSPLVEGDRVIVHALLADGGGPILALDKASGATVWSAGEGHPGYSSPVAVDLLGERQIVSFLGSGLQAVAAADGAPRWSFPWTTSYDVNAADPVFFPPDRFFISSGYDSGAAMVRVQRVGERWEAVEVWSNREMKNHFSSSVRRDDIVYGFDNATFKALAAANGEMLWRQRGFGKGSLLAAGDLLLVLGEKGELALVEATPEAYRELGRVAALEHGSWAPPSLAGAWVYLRDHHEIACLDLSPL